MSPAFSRVHMRHLLRKRDRKMEILAVFSRDRDCQGELSGSVFWKSNKLAKCELRFELEDVVEGSRIFVGRFVALSL